ncbi:MAG: beta-ketoacyl synthase N-terminal-like domain-containing protein, partial [Pseudomonadota bacterium]
MNNQIAIVGLSSILPGSNTTQGCWRNIIGKHDFIKEVPPSHFLIEDYYDPALPEFTKIYCKNGAFLDDYPFDPMEYSIPPNTLRAIDTAQLYGLVAAKKLLAGTKSVSEQKVSKKDISIIIGAAAGTEMVEQMAAKGQKPVWVKVLREHGLPESEVQEIAENIIKEYPAWTENTFPGLLTNVIAGRIANRLDLGGTNYVVDAACASSLSAISLATRELQAGTSDMVITGGVDAINTVL